MLIHANLGPGKEAVPVAFVAVGGGSSRPDHDLRSTHVVAMLVGSIGWSKKPGDKLAKGEELGWFQVS
jgi:phosphatidylserine decarboxylase